MLTKRHIFAGLFLVALFAAPTMFFSYFEMFSYQMEREQRFDAARANAAKHAYAAAEVYRVVRSLGFDADMAEDIVLRLGVLTEYSETIFKVSEPDATREIMKDMYNNQAGILAAQWSLEHEGADIRELVMRMAKEDVLVVTHAQVPMGGADVIEDYPQSVKHASHWFCEQQTGIKKTVISALQSFK